VLDILNNSSCRLNNAAMNIMTLLPYFEEASCIHSLNVIEIQIK